MPTKSDLQTATSKWQQRIAQAKAANVPDFVWKPLMQRDFNSIFQGHSPMADAEVSDAMRAAVGQSPIKDPSKGHGILDVIGNIPSDIQNLVTGFIPGAVGYVTSLPQQAADLSRLFQHDPATMKKYGWENPDDFGSLVRDMSNLPIFGPLVPGIHTIAQATTPEGRQWLEEHPVSTAIDVGAAVSAAGKLGLFGRGAVAGEEAATAAAREAATTPLEELKLSSTVEKTPMAALQKGEPYRAAGREALKLTEKISGGRIDRARLADFMFNHAAHPILREWLTRPFDESNTLTEALHRKFAAGELIQGLNKLSEEDYQLVNEAGRTGNMALLNGRPDLQSLEQMGRDWVESMARQHPLLRQVTTPWGHEYTYTKTHPVVHAFDAAKSADDAKFVAAARAQKALRDYMDRRQKYGLTDRRTEAALRRYTDANVNLNQSRKIAERAAVRYNTVLNHNAPAAFYPVLDEEARAQAADAARVKFADDQAKLNVALGRLRNASTWDDMGRALGDKTLADQIHRDVEATWSTKARNGVDPVYMPNVHESKINRVLNPSIFPDVRYATPFEVRNTMFNLSRTMYDFKIGLLAYNQATLIEEAQATWVDRFVKHFVMPRSKLHDDLTTSMGGPGMVDVRSQVQREMGTQWMEFKPDVYGMGQYFPKEGEQLMIPRGVARALDYLKVSKRHPVGPIQAVKDKTMNLWRVSVLSTPRHISHITLGGMTMGTLRDPLFLPHLIENYNSIMGIIHGDNEVLKAKFGRNIHGFNTDQLGLTGTGKTLGRLETSVRHPIDALNRFEEQITLMYKINVMLTKEKKLIAQAQSHGVEITSASKAAMEDEAIHLANKVFVDRSAMLPVERVIMNKIFPFYGFTRHLFRYLLTYPADHPQAASILTHFANQHEQDWNSGLARNLSFMFFLGAPDSNGNISAVDYRSIDPFRSFYNDFTLAGFWTQINPGIQFMAQMSGLNILSGSQELYPNTHYDPNTGQFVADRPSNPLLLGLETLIPETTAAEAYFGLTDQYRNLKISDPAAYRHRVLTALGLPFFPETFNVAQRVETAQMKRYRDAQTSINQAIQTGDFTKAKRYDYVPTPSLLSRYFPGVRYVTPQQAEAVYRALQQQANAPGVSIHALLPKATRTRTR